MTSISNELTQKCINTIRFLAVDGVQKANSGHPGMPMGCAPIAHLLYSEVMKHNPADSKWVNRDRFVLSAGHGSMLLYSILHLTGYKVSMEDLMSFRQWGSITPGHPEFGLTDGVETTTGPLGQGVANAIGMAVAYEHHKSKFNKPGYELFNHFIYAIASDGDLMEGINHEVAAFAGHNKLGNLIVFYDNNHISIEGSTELAMTEDVAKRYEAYGWQVLRVSDVNDLTQLRNAVSDAKKESGKPTIVITNTTIGYGSPNKQGKESSHGSPLGKDEVALTKKNLNWPEDEFFYIPDDVKTYYDSLKTEFAKYQSDWDTMFAKYAEEFPAEAAELKNIFAGNYGTEWISKLPVFKAEDPAVATRSVSGKVLNAIAPALPSLVGGSADLAPSNNTHLKEFSDFSSENPGGRNFHFGVREHAMGSIMNGMAAYGGLIPYGGTFMVFSDYVRPAVRLAALSEFKVVYVFTHDSIGLGEDGPTHQPVEHMAALRAIPGLNVFRPADATETVESWKCAIQGHKPVALALTRQNLPIIDRTKYGKAELVAKGGYILKDSAGKPELIIIGTGSEVQFALAAAEQLETKGKKVRVVSMPCTSIFDEQDAAYKESVLPFDVSKRISIEAGISMGWEKYVGLQGRTIALNRFGASAPYQKCYEEFGFTTDNVVKVAEEML